MIDLPGCLFTGTVFEGAVHVILEGRRREDGLPEVIEALRDEHASPRADGPHELRGRRALGSVRARRDALRDAHGRPAVPGDGSAAPGARARGAHAAAPQRAVLGRAGGRPRDAFTRAAAGDTRAVLLRGPAGIGRSALVREMSCMVARRGGMYGAGKAEPDGRAEVVFTGIRGDVAHTLVQLGADLSSVVTRAPPGERIRTRARMNAAARALLILLPENAARVHARA